MSYDLKKENDVMSLFDDFLKDKSFNDIYNEASFQFEFGKYLKKELGADYKVDFERNISYFYNYTDNFVKHEIDICIYKGDNIDYAEECYAFELKYPSVKKQDDKIIANGKYPETMKDFIKDLIFITQIKYPETTINSSKGKNQQSKFKNTYSIVLVSNYAESFYKLSNRDNTNNSMPYCFYRQFDTVSSNNTTDKYIEYIKEYVKENNINFTKPDILYKVLDEKKPIDWKSWKNNKEEIGKYHIICIK